MAAGLNLFDNKSFGDHTPFFDLDKARVTKIEKSGKNDVLIRIAYSSHDCKTEKDGAQYLYNVYCKASILARGVSKYKSSSDNAAKLKPRIKIHRKLFSKVKLVTIDDPTIGHVSLECKKLLLEKIYAYARHVDGKWICDEQMKHFNLQEVNDLRKLQTEPAPADHECEWKLMFLFHPPHLLNPRPFEYCGGCGIMRQLDVDECLRDQMREIIYKTKF